MTRGLAAYAFVVVLSAAVLAMNALFWPYDQGHPDRITDVAYIVVAAGVLSFVDVRVSHGRLSLHGIVSGAAVMLLNPLNATLVGITAGVKTSRRSVWILLANLSLATCINAISAATAVAFHGVGMPSLPLRLLVQVTWIVGDVCLTTLAVHISTGESVRSIARTNFNKPFLAAFGYFALAALLLSYLLNGSLLGYFLATIVCVLALALTDTIAGRRVRTVLESELSDADRHLFHSRAVEGVVHNLRNHMATAQAYLREIDKHQLDDVNRESLVTATEAANDAVAVLHGLAQGATPKVSFAPNPIDLNELAVRTIGMARPRARIKEVQVSMRESSADVKVRADPLLLREVMTNLVNNAIDAAPAGGRVDLSTGRRPNGSPYVSVADNGPGVAEDHRHHLFEPHFTTKEGGTGLGLFMSYGIVREHQGQLLFEGNRRGAIFTVLLPPFGS